MRLLGPSPRVLVSLVLRCGLRICMSRPQLALMLLVTTH